MSEKEIEIRAEDYLEAYTDTVYRIAECRALGNRLVIIVPATGASQNKFQSFVRKALAELKKGGKVSAYVSFSELHLDKTSSRYLLSFFPDLKNDVPKDGIGYVVKL